MISAKVNLGSTLKRLAQVPREATRIMDTVIDTDARGFVKDMVHITPPSMGRANVESKKRGEAAVAGDILTVYGADERLYALIRSYGGEKQAKHYWWLLQNDPVRLRRWLELSAPDAIRSIARGWDGGAEHARRRTRKGRVAGSKPTRILTSSAEARQMRAYIKKRQKNVGLLAAGLNAGALKLGVNLPAWVRRHGAPFSLVQVQRSLGRYSITIGNRTPFVGQTDVARRMQFVLASEKRKKRLIIRANAEIRAVLRRQRLAAR